MILCPDSTLGDPAHSRLRLKIISLYISVAYINTWIHYTPDHAVIKEIET